MDCAKCHAAMEIVTFGGIDVDRCTQCKGLWFDAREHEKLKGMKGAEVIDTGSAATGRKNNDVPNVRCPRCTTPMVRMVDAAQPHIWYETCSACGGVYFDAGEFRDYKEYTLVDVWRDLFARPRP